MKVRYDAVLFHEVPRRRKARRSWSAVQETNQTRKRQAIRDARTFLRAHIGPEEAKYQACVYEVRPDDQVLIFQAHLKEGRIVVDEL